MTARENLNSEEPATFASCRGIRRVCPKGAKGNKGVNELDQGRDVGYTGSGNDEGKEDGSVEEGFKLQYETA